MSDHDDLFDGWFGPCDDDGSDLRRYISGRRHAMRCPPVAILAVYAKENDPSLTPRRRDRVREHVRRCERCAAQVDRLFDGVFHDVFELLQHDYDANQARVQRRGLGFKQALHEQIKLKAPPLGSRYPVTDLVPIAAIVAVIAMTLVLLRPAVAVMQAEELIERALAYDRDHAGEPRRVRHTLGAPALTLGPTAPTASAKPFSEIRDVVDGAFVSEMRLVNMRERDAHAELARLLRQHGFDWRKPFCLTCYQTWRNSLSRKRDSVTLTGDFIQLRTTTSEGSLREVTQYFERDSLRLVRQTLLFEGLGLIALEEVERQSASAPASQRAAASAPSRGVVDTGDGTLAPSVSNRQPAGADVARAAQRIPLSRWLDRTFPPTAAAARSTFLPDVARLSSSVREHLVVLQRLANVSASEKVKEGTDADRAKMFQQVELEYQAVITHLRALEERLNLLLGTGTRSGESRTSVPADWQRRASTALPHATRLEHRLGRLFTHDDLPREETQASRPRSTRAAFEALWESIHGNQRENAPGWVPD